MKDTCPEPVSVEIMGRKYRLRCPPGEREALIAAARRLDMEMRSVRQRGAIGSERITIMAALNIAHELIQLQNRCCELERLLQKRLEELNHFIDDVLTEEESG